MTRKTLGKHTKNLGENAVVEPSQPVRERIATFCNEQDASGKTGLDYLTELRNFFQETRGALTESVARTHGEMVLDLAIESLNGQITSLTAISQRKWLLRENDLNALAGIQGSIADNMTELLKHIAYRTKDGAMPPAPAAMLNNDKTLRWIFYQMGDRTDGLKTAATGQLESLRSNLLPKVKALAQGGLPIEELKKLAQRPASPFSGMVGRVLGKADGFGQGKWNRFS